MAQGARSRYAGAGRFAASNTGHLRLPHGGRRAAVRERRPNPAVATALLEPCSPPRPFRDDPTALDGTLSVAEAPVRALRGVGRPEPSRSGSALDVLLGLRRGSWRFRGAPLTSRPAWTWTA